MPFAGASQTVPHAPQLAGSDAVATQELPHFVYPLSQVKSHLPPAHAAWPWAGTGQITPHPPQSLVFVLVSTQAPLQLVRGPVQVAPHLPRSHTWLAVQAVAQSPQCSGSLCVSTQLSPQLV